MKKWCSFLLAGILSLSLCSCSPGPAGTTPTPEPSPLEEIAVPEYSLINYDEYTQYGASGIGYRVEVSRDTSEEGMRAIFSDLCSGDTYALHTVWFYELASDIEDIGSFTVGMLEEKSKGSDPSFTPCSYEPELLASMRERSAEEAALAALNRSIPSDAWTWKHDALLQENSFAPANPIIFSTTGSENGLGGSRFYIEGEVISLFESVGYDFMELSSDGGTLFVGAVSFDFAEISDGDTVTLFFVYDGWSDALDGPSGTYVYHE